jgi:hypothetical protein
MGAVMIRCPRSGRAVSTEIETEPSVFSRLPEVAGLEHDRLGLNRLGIPKSGAL